MQTNRTFTLSTKQLANSLEVFGGIDPCRRCLDRIGDVDAFAVP
jgi:hypothetical protein